MKREKYDRAYLLAFYASADENIRFCKQQQWQVIFYAVSLNAALIALEGYVKCLPCSLIWLPSALIFFAAWRMIHVLKKDLTKFRNRQLRVERLLQRKRMLAPETRDRYSHWRHFDIEGILLLTALAASVLTGCILLRG